MTNGEIAEVFNRIAQILELQGENPFRIRAYQRAAQLLSGLSRHAADIVQNEGRAGLKALPGIGDDLSQKIEEMVKTGKLAYLEQLQKSLPEGLFALMEIEGVGPKKTKFLWEKFKIKSIDDLKKLAESGKLETLKGWGEKSVQNILKGLEQRKQVKGRLAMPKALEVAEGIVAMLKASKLCGRIEIAGSLRRRRETVGDIDILATSPNPEKLMAFFCGLPHVRRVTAQGETKSSVFLNAGLDADLRVVDQNVFGAALYYFTGSKDHNVRVRRLALQKGLTINEYGVHKGTAKKKGALMASATEEDVFRSVGLPFIPPELREDRGEIEAALAGKLPRLIEEKDIMGDLHMHSTFSDGNASMEEMARAAKEKGYAYIAITDHASPMGMVRGVKKENIGAYLKLIEKARKAVPGIRILAGAEVDILADGKLYLAEDVLQKLDWVIASVHGNFKLSPEDMTKRILAAIENPRVDAIAHPTTRILGRRPEILYDMDAVLKAAAKHNVAMELNASLERLDLSDIHLKRAKDLGVKIVINSDAHAPAELSLRHGMAIARRGWLETINVLNTKEKI